VDNAEPKCSHLTYVVMTSLSVTWRLRDLLCFRTGKLHFTKPTLHHANWTIHHTCPTLHHTNPTLHHAYGTLHHSNRTLHHANPKCDLLHRNAICVTDGCRLRYSK